MKKSHSRPFIRPAALLGTALALLLGCVTSENPADGGFFNGIAGATGGGYDARVAEREKQVASEKARNADLSQQLVALRADHNTVKHQLIQKRAKLKAAGIKLSASSENEIQSALRSSPQKIESLRKAIANARQLSAQLTALSRT
jgi:septal ring factor EnvC (AmiA/AmiB activator)